MVCRKDERGGADRLAILTLLLFSHFATTAVLGDSSTYPVKSLKLGDAATISFYNAIDFTGKAGKLEDPHPVHGIETSDGGFVYVGKALECNAGGGGEASNCGAGQDASKTEAYALKINSQGTSVAWAWTSGSAGQNDVANSVAQLPGGGAVLVAGFRTVGGILKRSVTKLDLATGAEVWTATDFGDLSPTSNGAWESIHIDAATSNVLLGGLKNKPDQKEMSFKSYGNCAGGTAAVVQLPVSAFTGGAAPTLSSAGYKAWSPAAEAGGAVSWNTVKRCTATTSGDVACLLWKDGVADKSAGIVLLKKGSDTPVWGPNMYGVKHGEGTDMVSTKDGGFAIAGHGSKNSAGTEVSGALFGRVTKVNSAGAWQWSKSFGSCGSDDPVAVCGTPYIKNEVWGLQESSDGGFVFSCGTGIENCEGMTGTIKTDCAAETKRLVGDTRAGAYMRKAAVWQQMFTKTDSSGAVVWQRVDAFRDSSTPALPASCPDPDVSVDESTCGQLDHSSASEHVIKATVAGTDVFVLVNDESTGGAIVKLVFKVAAGGSSTTVTSCPIGQEPNAGKTACAVCADGKVSATADLGACTACTAPKVANTGKTACEDPPAPVASNGKVLLIGDSYADYSKQYFAKYCGITVTNEGQGGTTAEQWSTDTRMKNALDAAPDATQVLYTIGGNDFMGVACALTRAQVKAVVLTSLNKLKGFLAAAGKGQTMTMLGYPMPTGTFPTPEGECEGSKPADLDKLNGAIEDACKDAGATYLDYRFVAGATENPLSWSPLSSAAGSLHADTVHLNEQGYCKVAISDSFRTQFKCTVNKEDQSCYVKPSSTTGSTAGSTDGKTPAELAKLDTATHAAGASSAVILLVAAAAVVAMF